MPTAPTITGAVGTGNILQGNRKIDMAATVSELQPDETPFVVLAKKLPHEVAVNPEYSHLENDLEPRFDTTTGAVTNVAVTVPVTNPSYWAQHDIGFVPRTGETFRVTAVAAPNLTVVRGVGQAGTGVAMNAAEELLITGSAQPEGDTSKPARQGQPVKVTNYTEIFTEPWEMTNTARESQTQVTPHEWQRQAGLKGVEHLKEIEYALLFHHPSEDLTGTQPRRTTGGARHYITTNVTDVGGAMTEAEFWAALRPIFRYGSKEKVWLSGALPITLINQFAQNKVQVVSPTQNRYGLNITQYYTPLGTLNIMPADYAFEGTTLGSEAMILDFNDANMKYRYINNRDTHIETNIQAPDADTRKDQYKTECGMQFGQEKKHGRIVNITS